MAKTDNKVVILPTRLTQDDLKRRGLHAEMAIQARMDGCYTHAMRGSLPHDAYPDLADYLSKISGDLRRNIALR